MARDTADPTPIEDHHQLAAFLEAGCKPPDKWRIGTEHEKFGFFRDGHGPIPYEGPAGVRALLEGMETLLGWEPIYADRSWSQDTGSWWGGRGGTFSSGGGGSWGSGSTWGGGSFGGFGGGGGGFSSGGGGGW